MASLNDLPLDEYAFPGPLRDRLVEAILAGRKTSTTALLEQLRYEGESLPVVGDRRVAVDSSGAPVCITEVTRVTVALLGEVDLEHVLAEGEGHQTVAEWRAAHEEFWNGVEFAAAMGGHSLRIDDASEVVLERFRALPLSDI